jgi:steroid delta-isomerase-like uncharacterized protein
MNHKDTLNTFIKEAFNIGNTGIINELIHPDYRYTSPSESLHGPNELAAFIHALRAAFPDLSVTVTDQIVNGESICSRVMIKGTHRGDFLDVPPTGNAIAIEGVIMSRFKNGLIHEEWELLDQYTFLSQLGVIQTFS